jgi:threonine/homoserine/homoserine lactone efflux protein
LKVAIFAQKQVVELVIFKGVITGLVLSVMIGPAFFILLETSIVKGIRAALAFDFGVLIADLFYIGIVYFFLSEVSSAIDSNRSVLTVVGGVTLIVYGVLTAHKKQGAKMNTDFINIVHQPRDFGILFLKGFLLNFLNPMVLFYWFTALTVGAESIDSQGSMALLFICAILFTFFSIDVLKIIGAKKLRIFITPDLLKRLNLILGVVLLIFGVAILVRGLVTI